jgi:hypothetical protein
MLPQEVLADIEQRQTKPLNNESENVEPEQTEEHGNADSENLEDWEVRGKPHDEYLRSELAENRVGTNSANNRGTRRKGQDGACNCCCAEWMQALKRLERVQNSAVEAQIETRQKRRQAQFKRREAWLRDSLFMKELQKRMAQQGLDGFDYLIKLAEDCQVAHDNFGPLEEEVIQAEQRMEGELWNLRQAEAEIFDKFEEKFQPEEDREATSESLRGSSSDTKSKGYEGELFPHATASPELHEVELKSLHVGGRSERSHLPGDQTHQLAELIEGDIEWGSDSGVGVIDRIAGNPSQMATVGPPQPLPASSGTVLGHYPELSTEFSTRRDRINRWILNTVLQSRHEADILRDLLNLEVGSIPSNWSQLVIAYWELDKAAMPPGNRGRHRTASKENASEFEGKISSQ